jgi:hypothetical protein
MASPQMRLTVFDDSKLTLFQQAIQDKFFEVFGLTIVNGLYLTGVTLTAASTTNVNHTLGRQALGYLVCSRSASANIWNGTMTDLIIPLNTSADCTVNLWVF